MVWGGAYIWAKCYGIKYMKQSMLHVAVQLQIKQITQLLSVTRTPSEY